MAPPPPPHEVLRFRCALADLRAAFAPYAGHCAGPAACEVPLYGNYASSGPSGTSNITAIGVPGSTYVAALSFFADAPGCVAGSPGALVFRTNYTQPACASLHASCSGSGAGNDHLSCSVRGTLPASTLAATATSPPNPVAGERDSPLLNGSSGTHTLLVLFLIALVPLALAHCFRRARYYNNSSNNTDGGGISLFVLTGGRGAQLMERRRGNTDAACPRELAMHEVAVPLPVYCSAREYATALEGGDAQHASIKECEPPPYGRSRASSRSWFFFW